MRSDTVIGIAACMRVIAHQWSWRRSARSMRDEAPDQFGEQAVETLDDRLQPQHQRGVDDILAGGAEMHLCAVRLADGCAQLAHQLRHDDAVARHAGPQLCRCRAENDASAATIAAAAACVDDRLPPASASASARSKAASRRVSASTENSRADLLVAEERREQRMVER